MPSLLIYGSYGYTGELIVPLAIEAGLRPVLAGRSREKVEPQAAEHGLEHRVFDLDDPNALDNYLKPFDVVLNCAGPFSRTALPLAKSCIRTNAHYLDITGEIEVFESLHGLNDKAKDAGVMLMPGVGFDVVPSDCLAAHLKRRLPDAADLTLAFKGVGKPSRGTATTMVENLHKGGLIRKNGQLIQVPSAWKMEDMDFGEGPVTCMTIPWGDVSTAYYSTGIPNIRVFMAAPAELRRMAVFGRYFGFVLGSAPVQKFLKAQIDKGPAGPSTEERLRGYSLLWGEAKTADGTAVQSRMRTPEGYTLTAHTAARIAQKALEGHAAPGFQTPSMVYGADFILEFDGVTRSDI